MSNYVTFIDNTGRNILAQKVGEITDTLVVENPVMILVQPQQNGQLSVQLIPLFLTEFVKPGADGSRNYKFVYQTSAVAVGTDFEIDDRVISQYQKIVEVAVKKPQTQQTSPEVIKLFEE